MAQAGQDLGLLDELLSQPVQHGDIEARLGYQLFDRDGHLQARVPGAVDGPIPPRPNRATTR